MQESFIRAYRQLGRFEARSNFGTWLHRIVVNCAMDTLRARQTRKTERLSAAVDDEPDMASSDEPSPERLALSTEIRRRVDASMAALTPQERVAFALRHYEGRSIDEIRAHAGRAEERGQARGLPRREEDSRRPGAIAENHMNHCSDDELLLEIRRGALRRGDAPQRVRGLRGAVSGAEDAPRRSHAGTARPRRAIWSRGLAGDSASVADARTNVAQPADAAMGPRGSGRAPSCRWFHRWSHVAAG